MAPQQNVANEEKQRLEEDRVGRQPWRNWGPYLSERQWGTVREDYSPYGDAWDYFPHDDARSRAYRWGEVCRLFRFVARPRPCGVGEEQ